MSAKRLRMRQLREILRLKFEVGLSHRAIVRACGVGLGTVTDYLQRVEAAGLRWPLPVEMDDVALEARVFAGSSAASAGRALPEWASVHRELRRDGVTLQLLWHEYIETHPDGYRYSQFCEWYRRWARKLNPSMRQVHRAGEKTFIPRRQAHFPTSDNYTSPRWGDDSVAGQTILDFGEPLLEQFDEEFPTEALRTALKIVITIWNAHVLATPVWGESVHLHGIAHLIVQGKTEPEMAMLLGVLGQRWHQRFSDDPRAVGEWSIERGAGACRFRCDARLPRERRWPASE